MRIVDDKKAIMESSVTVATESMGIVVENRDVTNRSALKVFIPRLMCGINIGDDDGKPVEKDVNFNTTKIMNTRNLDIGDGSVKIQNYLEVPCYQIPGISIPRYVAGQLVKVTFGDSDIKSPVIYPFSVPDNYKKLVDILNVGVPAKTDDADIDADSSYFLEFNSRDQFVRLHTADKNGENNPFNFLINTKDGLYEITDGSGRMFEWLCNKDTFHWTTDAGLDLELKENTATVKCDKIKFDIADEFDVKTSKIKIKADQGEFDITQLKIKGTKFDTDHTMTKIKTSATLTFACPGNSIWVPNIMPMCPFSPVHGGIPGGITMMKGEG